MRVSTRYVDTSREGGREREEDGARRWGFIAPAQAGRRREDRQSDSKKEQVDRRHSIWAGTFRQPFREQWFDQYNVNSFLAFRQKRARLARLGDGPPVYEKRHRHATQEGGEGILCPDESRQALQDTFSTAAAGFTSSTPPPSQPQ